MVSQRGGPPRNLLGLYSPSLSADKPLEGLMPSLFLSLCVKWREFLSPPRLLTATKGLLSCFSPGDGYLSRFPGSGMQRMSLPLREWRILGKKETLPLSLPFHFFLWEAINNRQDGGPPDTIYKHSWSLESREHRPGRWSVSRAHKLPQPF